MYKNEDVRNDVVRFRKLCDVLTKEHRWLQKQLFAEVGLSHTAVTTLWKGDVKDVKLRASTLGAIQDFIRKHIDKLNYAGVKSGKKDIDKVIDAVNRGGASRHPPSADEPVSKNGQFWVLIEQARRCKPEGVTINITLG